jgi:hypothetical protein
MEIFGQIIGLILDILGLILAVFLFRKAFKLYDRNKNAAGHLTVVIAAAVFLFSLPWFQGWAKSFIASNIISELKALGQQVNTVQETTTAMHTQLENHQREIDKHQKELNEVQAKIREAESSVFSQQTDITNQFRQISMVQSDLATAQTNILFQQAKLTNVESLVNSLFSNTEDEQFSASDTNKVIFLNLGGCQACVFRLKAVPIAYTIQSIFTTSSTGQHPLLPDMPQMRNILFSKFINISEGDFRGFHFRYIKDTRATNLFKNITIVNTNTVLLDGFQVILN